MSVCLSVRLSAGVTIWFGFAGKCFLISHRRHCRVANAFAALLILVFARAAGNDDDKIQLKKLYLHRSKHTHTHVDRKPGHICGKLLLKPLQELNQLTVLDIWRRSERSRGRRQSTQNLDASATGNVTCFSRASGLLRIRDCFQRMCC